MTIPSRTITLPVGARGKNLVEDARLVQQLLNAALRKHAKLRDAGVSMLAEDGRCGPKTIFAIESYQKSVLGWTGNAVDGTVHPNRTTWKSLNGNVADLTRVRKLRATKVAGYSAFRQGDYTGEKLGSGTLKIPGHGCALCTLTMAATAIGAPTTHWPTELKPDELTPLSANDILRKAGAFTGSSMVMSVAAGALGMTYDEYGRTTPLGSESLGLIESHMLAGNPVAAHVDYKSSAVGDHWILLVQRFPDGLFTAIDPATGTEIKLTKSPPDSKAMNRTDSVKNGVLFGWGMGGMANQSKYVVVRFGLLAPGSGGFCMSE